MTSSPARFPIWLPALFFVAFAIGTDDFVIAGILPQISRDLSVSPAMAGQLITVFSLTYAIAAPIAAVVTARWPRRTVMLVATGLFVVGNLLAAAVPTYAGLMGLRVALAIAGATITPAAVAAAASFAPPGKQGRYIGVVAAGLTVSLAVGVPVGTWLGGTFGWRSTMVFVAALAAVAMVGMTALPGKTRPPRESLRTQLAPLRRPAIGLGLAALFIAGSGGLMVYEYVAPIAAALTGTGSGGLAVIIASAGVCGAVGTWLGSTATDRFGPERTTIVAVGSQVAAVLLIAACGLLLPAGELPVAGFAAMLSLWALAGWAFNPAMHLRLIRLAGNAGTEVIGLSTSALFFGISAAGGIGGAVLAGWGAPAVPLVSAVLSLCGLVVFAISWRLFPGGDPSPATPVPVPVTVADGSS